MLGQTYAMEVNNAVEPTNFRACWTGYPLFISRHLLELERIDGVDRIRGAWVLQCALGGLLLDAERQPRCASTGIHEAEN